MCGISVVVDRTGGPVDPAIVTAMNARVLHRGPDDEGIVAGPSLCLGHRRLAILDLSTTAKQPMWFGDHLVVTYNGEIYNYVELRAELARCGYEFRTTSDTEVLLAAYDCWGEDCVRHFNGMWAFVLWDQKRRVLFCSRDRFGVKPLHYLELGSLVAIASEVKQFLALPGFAAKPDSLSVYRLFMDGVLGVDEREFAAGVRSLRGGHNLRLDLDSGRLHISRWYDIEAVNTLGSISFADAARQFRELFFDAVRIRLRSDVAVGVCLSGGVDSSSIASVAARIAADSGGLRSVSCVWNDPACDESVFIDHVVRTCGLEPVISRPNMDDLLSAGALDRIVYHQDQPVWSASQFSEHAVFGAARQAALVVMLDGQGADEYLAGYGWFFPPFVQSLVMSGKVRLACREVSRRSALRALPLHASARSLWSALVVSRIRDRLSALSAKRRKLEPWAGPQLRELHRDPALEPARYHGASSLREMSIRELLDTSMPHQLHSEDRNSMSHSIESRLPFMDYRLVEFGLSLPDTFKLRDGATKAIVREALDGVLPDVIRNRHDKVGFPAPEERWVRRSAALVRRELAAAVERFPALLAPPLLERFDQMTSQNAPYDPLFFRVVALNRWAEVFAESGPVAPRANRAVGREFVRSA